MTIHTERVWERAEPKKGPRVLVDRRWPPGTGEKALRMESWYESVALSSQLRKWFNHHAARWDELKRRQFAESASSLAAWNAPAVLVGNDEVMLLYTVKDQRYGDTEAVRDHLGSKLRE